MSAPMDYDKLARALYDTLGTPLDDCALGELDNDLAKIAQALERAEVEGRIAGMDRCFSMISDVLHQDIAALRKRLVIPK